MKDDKRILRAVIALLFAPLLASGHHQIDVKYNPTQPVTLKGTVTRMEWSNPHVRLYVQVKDPSGNKTNWALEMGSPSQQLLNGWKIDTFKRGDQVRVQAYPARDGSPLGYATRVSHQLP